MKHLIDELVCEMPLIQHLAHFGISLPGWPEEPVECESDNHWIQRGQAYAEGVCLWREKLRSIADDRKAVADQLLRYLNETQQLEGWDRWLALIIHPIVNQNLQRDCSTTCASALFSDPLSRAQILGGALALAEAHQLRAATMGIKHLLNQQTLSGDEIKDICTLYVAKSNTDWLINEAKNSSDSWQIAVALNDQWVNLTQLVETHCKKNGTPKSDLNRATIKILDQIIECLSEPDEETIAAQTLEAQLPTGKQQQQRGELLQFTFATHRAGSNLSALYPDDRFSADVYHQVYSYALETAKRKNIAKVRTIKIISGRLGRYFDASLNNSIGDTIAKLWNRRSQQRPFETINISLSDHLSCDIEVDTLYLLCGHAIEAEIAFTQAIVNTPSAFSIGWLWDNHHSFIKNIDISKSLDIVIPSHHYGWDIISNSHPHTTRPLPLATCQWSIPTFKGLSSKAHNRRLTHLLNGKYSDWAPASNRKEIARYIDYMISDNKLFDIRVETPEKIEEQYLRLPPIDAMEDWSRSMCSLVLAVKKDLSMRFFDSMLCRSVPIVDKNISRQALRDLEPGIAEHKHYKRCEPENFQALVKSINMAAKLRQQFYTPEFTNFLLYNHTVESRLAIIIHAALTAIRDASCFPSEA